MIAFMFRYWRWSLALLAVVIVLFGSLAYTLYNSGAASFVFFLILAVVGIAIYRGLRREMPPLWIMVVTICIPIFLWGFSVVKPEWYATWRHSSHFYWMIVTAIVLGWLANHSINPVASAARKGLILLMIAAVGFGAWGQFQRDRDEKKMVAENKDMAKIATAGYTGIYPCPHTFTLEVTTVWSQTITRPPGCEVTIRRESAVAYQMGATTINGDTIVDVPVGERPRSHVPDLRTFRFRVMEGETAKTVRITVGLYRP